MCFHSSKPKLTTKIISEQQCIPLGCVPSPAVSGRGGLPRGCLPRGVSAWGCLSGRGCLPRGVSARHPPCGQNDRRVKTLPCHSYIADNNKNRMCTARLLTLSPSDRGGSPPGCRPPWNQTPGCSRPLVM